MIQILLLENKVIYILLYNQCNKCNIKFFKNFNYLDIKGLIVIISRFLLY